MSTPIAIDKWRDMPRRRIRAGVQQNEAAGVGLDAFTNFAARMGYGTPSLPEATSYPLIRLTLNYWLMISLYRNHWIIRRIIDTPATDMTKAWPKLSSELDPKDIKNFERTLKVTGTKEKVRTAIAWGDLFGGAGALMVIDGHDDILAEPLDIESVEPGSYKGLIPFDRWSGITPGMDLSTDLEHPRNFGLPEYYEVRPINTAKMMKVHHTRILRFSGPEVPQPEYQANTYWGISKVEIIYEELRKRDNMSWSILNLLFRAQILAQTNPELAQMLSGIGSSQQALMRFAAAMEAQNELLSNQSMMILGKDGSLQSHQYSFSGVSEVYQQFQLDIAGAAEMPVTRLFGRTITGLGQSNDADERLYEEKIAERQEHSLRPQLDKLYQVIAMSEFGEIPEDLDYTFPSIRVLTEQEKADLAKNVTDSVVAAYGAGLVSQRLALEELQQLGDATNVWSNITDEIVDKADDTAGGAGGMMGGGGELDFNAAEKVGRGEPATKAAGGENKEKGGAAGDSFFGLDEDFKESDHPRDKTGKFKKGAGEASASSGGATSLPESMKHVTKGNHKHVQSFVLEQVKNGYSYADIAQAARHYFGKKTTVDSVKWYLNAEKNKQKQAAAAIGNIVNNATIAAVAKTTPVQQAKAVEEEVKKNTPPGKTMLFKFSTSSGTKYFKIEGVPENSPSVAAVVIKKIQASFKISENGSSLGEYNPATPFKPVAQNSTMQDVTLTAGDVEHIKKEALAQAAELKAKADAEAKTAAKKAELTAKSYVTTTHTLNEVQKKALEGYTDGTYHALNKALRSGSPLDQGKANICFAIDQAMKSSHFASDGFVYRSIAAPQAFFGPEIKKGIVVLDNGYVSCSKKYMPGSFGGQYTIRVAVKKGDRAIDVSGFSLHPGEEEIILPRGSMFRIEEVHGSIIEVSYVSGQ